jgi:hypothetical protein
MSFKTILLLQWSNSSSRVSKNKVWVPCQLHTRPASSATLGVSSLLHQQQNKMETFVRKPRRDFRKLLISALQPRKDLLLLPLDRFAQIPRHNVSNALIFLAAGQFISARSTKNGKEVLKMLVLLGHRIQFLQGLQLELKPPKMTFSSATLALRTSSLKSSISSRACRSSSRRTSASFCQVNHSPQTLPCRSDSSASWTSLSRSANCFDNCSTR